MMITLTWNIYSSLQIKITMPPDIEWLCDLEATGYFRASHLLVILWVTHFNKIDKWAHGVSGCPGKISGVRTDFWVFWFQSLHFSHHGDLDVGCSNTFTRPLTMVRFTSLKSGVAIYSIPWFSQSFAQLFVWIVVSCIVSKLYLTLLQPHEL